MNINKKLIGFSREPVESTGDYHEYSNIIRDSHNFIINYIKTKHDVSECDYQHEGYIDGSEEWEDLRVYSRFPDEDIDKIRVDEDLYGSIAEIIVVEEHGILKFSDDSMYRGKFYDILFTFFDLDGEFIDENTMLTMINFTKEEVFELANDYVKHFRLPIGYKKR